jgi:hypothetical protein
LAHVQNTHRQYNLPEIGQTSAYTANRDGVAERLPAPAVPQRLEVALALSDYYEPLLTDLELHIVHTATHHDANTFSRLPSLPGVGKIVALVRRDAIHASRRFPRVQDVASSGRLGKGATAAAGTRSGTAGKKIGHASLTWAWAAAAVRFLRHHAKGQPSLVRLEHQHGQGKALTVRAHKWARAVYSMLPRATVLNRALGLNGYARRAGKPDASRDT